MAAQAANTLASLSAGYQRDVSATDYEVVVVENRSANTLSQTVVDAFPDNFSYTLRDEPGVSPAAAINAGIAQAKAPRIGLIIDGARMLSPGVLRLVLDSQAAYPDALINVPGYYLTEAGARADHGRSGADTREHEQALLESIDWRQHGYRLFQQAIFSNGNRNGYLRPFMESTAFFVNRWALDRVGGADEAFQLQGGGPLVLHLFRQLGLMPKLQYLVLPGEGNFHQFHGGVSTRRSEQRDALVATFKQELDARWPGGYKALTRESVLLGKVGEYALPHLQASCQLAEERNRNFQRKGEPIWPDADAMAEYHGELGGSGHAS